MVICGCKYAQKFPDKAPSDGLVHCMAYSQSERLDGLHWSNYPVCGDNDCPLKHPELLEGARLEGISNDG